MKVLDSKRLSWSSRCLLICVALLAAGVHQAPAQERAIATMAIRQDRPLGDVLGGPYRIRAAAIPATVSGSARAGESEPNNQFASANEAELGDVFDGRIDRPGDFDVFALTVAAGTALDLELAARSIGSLLDPTLSLSDECGTRLAYHIDADGSGSRIHFTVPSYGRYFISVRGFGGSGGSQHTYRLTIDATEPGPADPTRSFAARLSSHAL